MKQTRLLEIIREEISNALNEWSIDVPNPAALTPQAKINLIKTARNTTRDNTIGLAKNPVEFLEEDMLTEGPFIEGPLDFAYIDGKLETGILGKAVATATQAIKTSFPNVDPEAAAQIITGKKSRTSDKTPDAVKSALVKIDDAILAQVKTFDDTNLLKDLLNKGEIGKDPKEIERINSYIEPDEKSGDVKRYVTKLGFPQTLNAVEKSLSGEAPTDMEPKTVKEPAKKAPEAPKAAKTAIEPKATNKPTAEPKAATLTKGDDGFDKVSYSEPKAATEPEPKTAEKLSPEDRADAAASKTPKLDKLASNQDSLLKAQKATQDKMKITQDKMKEVATQYRTAEGAEQDKFREELKKLNSELNGYSTLNGEIQSKIDKLY